MKLLSQPAKSSQGPSLKSIQPPEGSLQGKAHERWDIWGAFGSFADVSPSKGVLGVWLLGLGKSTAGDPEENSARATPSPKSCFWAAAHPLGLSRPTLPYPLAVQAACLSCCLPARVNCPSTHCPALRPDPAQPKRFRQLRTTLCFLVTNRKLESLLMNLVGRLSAVLPGKQWLLSCWF